MSNNIETLLVQLAESPANPEVNFKLAIEYDNVGQLAAAVSYYLRTAEFAAQTHPNLSYACLLKIASCFERQKERDWNVSNALLQAIQHVPNRPEAYFLLSRFYEQRQNWQESFTMAELGLQFAEEEHQQLPVDVGYHGKDSLVFQKAVSGWWVGRLEESKKLLFGLSEVKTLHPDIRQAVSNNFRILGLSLNKIAIVLPVRDAGTYRSQRLISCLNSWAQVTEGLSDIHIIMDEDDTQHYGYLFENKEKLHLHIKPAGLTLMQKINTIGLELAYIYKYMAFIGDDIEFKTPWESKFIEYLSSVPAGLVYGNTLDLPDEVDWATHPCITSNLVQAVGFYGCPAVEHNFFDNYWSEIAKELGYFKYIPEVIMDHRRLGWQPDHLYHKIVNLLESDRKNYQNYKDTQFERDLQRIKAAIGI